MALTVEVPLNTMLADLDQVLRTLLKREFARHGFDGVEVLFDAPDTEWAAGLSAPVVNLFLYDIREARELRPIEWELERVASGELVDVRPPLVVDASYAVTAWTRAVEDEHSLLSQMLAILYAFPELPDETLVGTLANGSQPYPLRTRLAQDRHEDKSDFWTSVGGQYKASLDYVVTLSCEPGTTLERGPEVRTHVVRVQDAEEGRGRIDERNRVGGIVTGADGQPVADAWVLVHDRAWATTDARGRFRVDGLDAGTYRVAARGPDGSEAEGELVVPGLGVELTLGGRRTREPTRPRR